MNSASARHIVITGASGGIGAALALAYARPGTVLGLIGRDAARLEACAQRCRAAGSIAVTRSMDVRDSATMQGWLEAFDDQHPIDLLIANAGVASTLSGPRDHESLACLREVTDTNFYGTLHAVVPAAARMRTRGHGQIAIVSSLAAWRGMAISPAYCASKSALKAYGEAMRPLLARRGVRLSLVFPGFVKTAMSDVYPGNKPFLWSADKAARHIQRKLAAGRYEIAFPRLLAFSMSVLSVLPPRIGDLLLDRVAHARWE
jgi:short-subunit dehydrogenase